MFFSVTSHVLLELTENSRCVCLEITRCNTVLAHCIGEIECRSGGMAWLAQMLCENGEMNHQSQDI
jgi:hypothetical protein